MDEVLQLERDVVKLRLRTAEEIHGVMIGIAVRKGNDTMRLALNWALFRVWEQGRFADLWLRYFPISPF